MAAESDELNSAQESHAEGDEVQEILDLMEQAFRGLRGTEAAAVALETLIFCARERRIAPDWASIAACIAFDAYKGYQFISLGKAFGFADHTHPEAKRKKLRRGAVAARVYSVRNAKESTGDPISLETAYGIVADQLGAGFSSSTVRDLVKAWEAGCKHAGRDPHRPNTEPGTASDALRVEFAEAFAANIKTKK